MDLKEAVKRAEVLLSRELTIETLSGHMMSSYNMLFLGKPELEEVFITLLNNCKINIDRGNNY